MGGWIGKGSVGMEGVNDRTKKRAGKYGNMTSQMNQRQIKESKEWRRM